MHVSPQLLRRILVRLNPLLLLLLRLLLIKLLEDLLSLGMTLARPLPKPGLSSSTNVILLGKV